MTATLIPTNMPAPINAGGWYRGSRTWGQAIQAAMDYAANRGIHATVQVPPGSAIELVEPIYMRNNVRLDAQREFLVSTASFPTGDVGAFVFTSCSNAGLIGVTLRMTNQQTAAARFTGLAHNSYIRDFNIINGRSIWFKSISGTVYLNNIRCQGGTALIGGATTAGDSFSEVIAHGLFATSTIDEAVDLNFGVDRFIANGFLFKGCYLVGTGGETVDIGGGVTKYVQFSNGVVDCGGRGISGFKIKDTAANVDLHGVHVINSDLSTAFGIHFDDCTNVNLDGTFIDHTFQRGIFMEPGVSNVSGNIRCNSPIVINGAENISFNVLMDLKDITTTVLNSAFSVAASAGPVALSGQIINYIGNAVSFTTCSSFMMNDLDIRRVRRGINSDRGGDKITMNDVVITSTSLYGVVVSSLSQFHVNNLRVFGYGIDSNVEAVRVGDVSSARFYDWHVKGGFGHPLHIVSGNNIHYNNIINEQVSSKSVSVNGAVTNITAGTTITWT